LSDAIAVAPAIDLLAKNTITIGVMARLDRSKGLDYAVKAIKNLEKFSSEKNQKFTLKLAGKGEQEAHLQRLVKDLALENSVEFLGWVENKREFFDSIDIFCIPSRRETFGLVLLEAMKYRKPIISTDADGPKEFLRGGIDALLVSLNPPCNVEDRIAQAVIRMVSEPNLAKKMIENSFVRLNEKFSYQSLEKSLQEVVGRAPIPNIPRF
jgi:glycosyltransferase involved in cell wall biosynthesis